MIGPINRGRIAARRGFNVKTKSLRQILQFEKILGSEIRDEDLAFLHADFPLSEIEMLKNYSAVDSATFNLAGVAVMQDKVAAVLNDLGFEIQMIKGEDRFGELLLAERPGRLNKFITLITHSDTVLANYREFKIELSEDKAYGSGVIDNKGGLIVGLSGLSRFLKAFPETEYSIRFICSPNEEIGSIGFNETFRELGADTYVAFGLEPALDNGSIVHQRRGNRWYDIEIKGREAHAGRSYGEHANAAHDAARKIVKLSKLTNYKKDISVNVGHFEGGKGRHNIICGSAKIKLDTRFPSMESRDKLHQKIVKILAKPSEISKSKKFRSETSFEIVDDCPPFSLTKPSRRMAAQYAALVSRLEGCKIRSEPAGGAGDVNYLSRPGNFVLDGLGPVGGEMHTQHEYVRISTLKTRAQALAGYLHYLQNKSL